MDVQAKAVRFRALPIRQLIIENPTQEFDFFRMKQVLLCHRFHGLCDVAAPIVNGKGQFQRPYPGKCPPLGGNSG